MNAKFFITVLVGVTLPWLSLQELVRNCGTSTYRRDDVIVASELSENAPVADDQIRNFLTDARDANADINAGVVYFSNTDSFQFTGLFPASLAVTASFPVRSVLTGATLVGGLRGIRDNLNVITVNRRRVQVPVIYASQISRRDIEEITNIVGGLRENNVHVYLFAVGSAILDNNLDNLRGNLTRVTGRDIVFTIPNLANLGQEITRQVLECDFIIPNPLCSKCIIEESSALISHPTKCDRYIQCYIQGNKILSTEVFCPHNTLYDRSLSTCQHANKVINDRNIKTGCDWCNSSTSNGPYQYRDSCASYWQCGRTDGVATIEAMCCPEGQSFDTATKSCINDFGCDRTVKHPHASYCKTYFQCNGTSLSSQCCSGTNGFVSNNTFNDCAPRTGCVDQNCLEPRTFTCNAVAYGDCQFRQVWGDIIYEPQDCIDGYGFSEATCTCSIKLPEGVVCPTPMLNNNTLDCKDNFLTTMAKYDGINPSFDDEEPWPWNIQNNNVAKSTTIGGIYDGDTSYLSIPRTAGTGEATKNGTWVRIVYQDGTQGNNQPLSQPRVLLSNAPCEDKADVNEGASISVTTTPSDGLVRVRLVTNSDTEFDYTDDVPVSVDLRYRTDMYGPNDKKTVTFFYDNKVLTATLNINGIRVDNQSSTASTTGNSPIGTRSCALKVGKGLASESLFKGTIDRVEMHFGCQTYPDL